MFTSRDRDYSNCTVPLLTHADVWLSPVNLIVHLMELYLTCSGRMVCQNWHASDRCWNIKFTQEAANESRQTLKTESTNKSNTDFGPPSTSLNLFLRSQGLFSSTMLQLQRPKEWLESLKDKWGETEVGGRGGKKKKQSRLSINLQWCLGQKGHCN